MREFITDRLKKKRVSITELSRRLGINRQTVYGEMDSDLRLSSLLKMMEGAGYQLGVFDPVEKKFHRITQQDLKK